MLFTSSLRGFLRACAMRAYHSTAMHAYHSTAARASLAVVFFSSSGVRAPKWTRATLTLARVLLCHRHLDHGTRKLLVRAMVKTAFAYLQSCERERGPRPEQRRQRLHIGAAGGSTRTLARLFPRASPLGERCPVVDTVPKAIRTPPRVPLAARALKSHLFHRCRLEETASGALLLTERGVESCEVCIIYGRIDLVSSSSIDHTANVFSESDV